MRLIAGLVALALAASPSISAELGAGLALTDDPRGARVRGTFAWTVRAGVEQAASEQLRLGADLALVSTSFTQGVSALQVDTSFLYVALPLRAGWDLLPGERAGFTPYVSAGPALTRSAVRYAVTDPLGPGAARESAAGLHAGAAFGGGVQLVWKRALQPRFRVDATWLTRSDSVDALFTGVLGLAF